MGVMPVLLYNLDKYNLLNEELTVKIRYISPSYLPGHIVSSFRNDFLCVAKPTFVSDNLPYFTSNVSIRSVTYFIPKPARSLLLSRVELPVVTGMSKNEKFLATPLVNQARLSPTTQMVVTQAQCHKAGSVVFTGRHVV